jgi:hypothetical protein
MQAMGEKGKLRQPKERMPFDGNSQIMWSYLDIHKKGAN